MKAIATLAAVVVAAGCAARVVEPPRSYDFGIAAPAARMPAVRVAPVRAAAPLDGVEMHYRLAWRNAAELATFAQSRWTAAPAELLRRQLLRAAGEGPAKCTLEIELQEFSQIFSSPGASQAHIELRAGLVGPKGRLGERGFRGTDADGGADAAGGAAALARAADRVIGDVAAWVDAQADCRLR